MSAIPIDILGPADATALAVPTSDPGTGPRPVPPALAYARDDVPIAAGIAYEVVARRARLVVPNSRRLRYQLTELAVPVALLLYAVLGGWTVVRATAAGLSAGRWPDLWDVGFNAFLAVTFAAATWVGVRQWHRSLRGQTVFELDEDRLTILDRSPAGRPRSRSWSRDRVAKVVAGPVPWTAPADRGLGIHVYATGRDIVEVMPGHPPAVAGWVADRLTDALRAEPEVDEAAVEQLLAGRA